MIEVYKIAYLMTLHQHNYGITCAFYLQTCSNTKYRVIQQAECVNKKLQLEVCYSGLTQIFPISGLARRVCS